MTMTPEMLFDSVGLGYSVERGELRVHYPRRDPATGKLLPGEGGILWLEIPAHYWTSPPNDITRERVEIWKQLGADSRYQLAAFATELLSTPLPADPDDAWRGESDYTPPPGKVSVELHGGPFDGVVIQMSERDARDGFVFPLADMLSPEHVGRMMEGEPKKGVYRLGRTAAAELAFLWDERAE